MAARALTAKQRLFAEAYDGNGTAAAKAAGYKGNDHTLAQVAVENLSKPEIAAVIRARQETKKRPLIATREARQRFWTKVMRSPRFEPKDRLKASELLGRSEADFTEKLEHAGKDGQPLNVSIHIGPGRKKDA